MNKAVIVILNYNDFETTERLCNKIKDYKVFSKIVLVDNCSSDDSYERLLKLQNEHIEVLKTKENGGYAKGNNYGIRYAISRCKPDVVFVANPDVAFEEKVAVHMIETLMNNENMGIIAPLVNQGYNVWGQWGFWGIIEALFLVTFNVHKKLIKNSLKGKKGCVEAGVVEGSFFALKTEAYLKAGGFDERTFLYCEENILGKRMKNHGYTTGVLVEERYDHLHSQSIKKHYRSKAKAFKNFDDSFKLYLKEYVKANKLQMFIYAVCYKLAYFERVIYDFIKRVKK